MSPTGSGKEVDEITPAISVIQQLIEFLDADKSDTFQEFHQNIRSKINDLKKLDSSAEVACISEIFLRYTSLKSDLFNNFKDAREDLKNRGRIFLNNVRQAKCKVAKTGQAFITDGSVILVHSASRVVFLTLKEAFTSNKRFTVYVTESSPSNQGYDMKRWLDKVGIVNKVISDASIGYFMESVDLVMVGAETVVKNGGIINRTGSYPVAVCASIAHKPVYVMVESYKFSQLYPLKQKDIPRLLKKDSQDDPGVDYTPPHLLTLLITDLGPLATAAVSDVLMQLYV